MARKISLYFLLFIFVFPKNVFAQGTNTYYVSTSGSDSNPGTIDRPFRTIQKGVDTVAADGTVYVRGGTYHEQVDIIGTGTVIQPTMDTGTNAKSSMPRT